jgi:hypothetical protein
LRRLLQFQDFFHWQLGCLGDGFNRNPHRQKILGHTDRFFFNFAFALEYAFTLAFFSASSKYRLKLCSKWVIIGTTNTGSPSGQSENNQLILRKTILTREDSALFI